MPVLKIIGRSYAIENGHLKTLVEEIKRQSVRELSLIMGANISLVADDLKKIGKMMKLSETQNVLRCICEIGIVHFLIE